MNDLINTLNDYINFHAAYIVTASLLCLLLYIFLHSHIDRVRQKRLVSLKRKFLDPVVETETPIENPAKAQRELGVESIETRFNFVKRFLPFVILGIWFSVVIMPYLTRVPAIYVSIVIGSISVLVGIAARPFIENLISGLVISFSQPYRIGDTVMVNDHYGVVEDIRLTHTLINIWDWRRLVVPNGQMLTREIINYSINDMHIWAWIEFYVSGEVDLDEVEKKAKEIASNSDVFLDVEEPAFWVMGLEKDSVRCWLAAWVDGPTSAWAMRSHMRRELAKYFRSQNISFHIYHVDRPFGPPPDKMASPKL